MTRTSPRDSRATALAQRPQARVGFAGGFTVVMSVYARDRADLFARALDSVFANSLQPDDFVLVEDGPLPDPLAIQARRVERAGGRVVRLPENGGLARALNAGLRCVRTEWVARADADDVNLPHRFQEQAAAVHALGDEIDLLGGAVLEVDDSGAPVALRTVPTTADAISARLRSRNPFNHMTVAYRTAAALAVGGYPEILLKEDYALWASMIAAGARCANLPGVLVHASAGRAMYRRRGGIRYARTEFALQRHLCRVRQQRFPGALVLGVARAVPACLPGAVRGWIYETLLRRPVASA